VHLKPVWSRRLPFTGADGLPIFLYHKVGDYPQGAPVKAQYVAPALFRTHLSFLWRNGYRAVSGDHVARYVQGDALPVERPMAITFDDGYDCLYSEAFPALQEFGSPATVFVVAARIGGVNDWEPHRVLTYEPILTAAHIVEMVRAGIAIGSHGMLHEHMPRLSDAELRGTLRDSKALLEDLIGREVTAVAYPFGEHDERVRAMAAEAGYTTGYSTQRGVNRPGTDPFLFQRINVRRYAYLPLFARKLRLAYLIPPSTPRR
jgi:peptidoglycan/xylan/chitin deacetylase (PgdA/CDA1 family)